MSSVESFVDRLSQEKTGLPGLAVSTSANVMAYSLQGIDIVIHKTNLHSHMLVSFPYHRGPGNEAKLIAIYNDVHSLEILYSPTQCTPLSGAQLCIVVPVTSKIEKFSLTN